MGTAAEKAVYLREVEAVLPRILGYFDRDRLSPTLGIGDRPFWAWKTVDFANATHQGSAHGLARLLDAGLLPRWLPADSVLRRVDEVVSGTARILRRDGSLEEALPFEKSFCVTALIAFDLLAADALLHGRLDGAVRERLRDTVRPMIGFLHYADESHGLISNHLATAAAALFRWTAATGEPGEERGRLFLDRILERQSHEGWFVEYDGADPGYQSLALYYLADLHRCRPDLGLIAPLRRSLVFLSHFLHPDGSFGGLYGSRNTRFLVPAGLEALAPEIAEAESLALAARRSVQARATVTLASMDAANLAPMFNAYCWAAAEQVKRPALAPDKPLPWEGETGGRVVFHQAGLVVDWGLEHYTVVATRKGGAYFHCDRRSGQLQLDGGPLAVDHKNHHYTTQRTLGGVLEERGSTLQIDAPLARLSHRLPNPFDFIVLRLLSLTVMRSSALGNLVKRMLVRLLVSGRGAARGGVRVRRCIVPGPDLRVTDELLSQQRGLRMLPPGTPYSAIHMAGQGYWQRSDDNMGRPADERPEATPMPGEPSR